MSVSLFISFLLLRFVPSDCRLGATSLKNEEKKGKERKEKKTLAAPCLVSGLESQREKGLELEGERIATLHLMRKSDRN